MRRGRRPIDENTVDAFGGGGRARRVREPGDVLDDASTVLLTTAATADLLGVSSQAVRKATRAGMPKHARNVFKLSEVLSWWLERRDREATANAENARELYYRAQTRSLNHRHALETGAAIPDEEHEAVVTELLVKLRELLASAPAKVTRDPKEIAQLEGMIDASLSYLAEQIERMADRRARRAAAAQASASTKRRPVGRPTTVATR